MKFKVGDKVVFSEKGSNYFQIKTDQTGIGNVLNVTGDGMYPYEVRFIFKTRLTNNYPCMEDELEFMEEILTEDTEIIL